MNKKYIIITSIILFLVIVLGMILYTIYLNRLEGQSKIKTEALSMEYEDLKEYEEILLDDNMTSKIRAVVVKVYDKNLCVMEIGRGNELINVGFTDEGNIGFAKGQEILIYFDGMIMTSSPAQLGNVGKIEIVKEESDIQIPDNILKLCYSSSENVSISIKEITRRGVSFTITDTNEFSYEYSNEYTIYKKNNVEDITEIDLSKFTPATESSTSSYQGTGMPLWEEVPKISDIQSENTGVSENIDEYTISKTYNWADLYGELEKNEEYEFVLPASEYVIRIRFLINETGEILYNQPTLSY